MPHGKAAVELCSAKAVVKTLNDGAVAWFGLLRDFVDDEPLAHSTVVSGCLHGVNTAVTHCTLASATNDRLQQVCDKYASVF